MGTKHTLCKKDLCTRVSHNTTRKDYTSLGCCLSSQEMNTETVMPWASFGCGRHVGWVTG